MPPNRKGSELFTIKLEFEVKKVCSLRPISTTFFNRISSTFVHITVEVESHWIICYTSMTDQIVTNELVKIVNKPKIKS